MSRVKGLDSDQIPASLRPVYEQFTQGDRDFTNQADILLHSPPAFLHLYGLIEALRRESTLPQRIVEIAVVTTSRVNECAYCVGHHGAALIRHGLALETVEAILEDAPPGLDEKELLVRDYARLVTERAWGISPHIFEGLRSHFNDREIVELTVRIGVCGLFNKLNQALEVGIEDDVAREIAESGLALSGVPVTKDKRR